MWVLFWDMHSGGSCKVRLNDQPKEKIYIEAASQDEAEIIFYNRFGHNPNRVTCTCCGPDYSISEGESLERLSGYHRNCATGFFRPDGTECDPSEAQTGGRYSRLKGGYTRGYVERRDEEHTWKTYLNLEDYLRSPEVLVIRAADIKPEERVGSLPRQGYVWVDED